MENKPIVSNSDDLGPLLQSLVITSDPQYPWTPCTDNQDCSNVNYSGQHCGGCTDSPGCVDHESETGPRKQNSIQLITDQYNKINEYAESVGTDKVTMILNGDVTAFGHNQSTSPEYQWDDMKNMLKILKIPYYFGLGNHDQINNRNNCKNVITGDYDLCYENSMKALINQDLSTTEPGHSQWDYRFTNSWGTTFAGSYAYHTSFRSSVYDGNPFPYIHMIQLNSYPTLTHPNNTYRLEAANIEDWLQYQLDYPANYDNPYITILNVHQADGWSTNDHAEDDHAKQQFIDLLKLDKYKGKIAAVFTGHYHYETGSSTRGFDIWGDIPVFLSGSAMNKSFLILEQYRSTHVLYLVCGNDWKNKVEIARLDYANQKFIELPAQDIPAPADQVSASLVWGSSGGPTAVEYLAKSDIHFSDYYSFNLKGESANMQQDGYVYKGEFDQVFFHSRPPVASSSVMFPGGTVYLLLPTSTSTSFETAEAVENITQQVQALFTSPFYTALALTTSSYQIHQLLLKVQAISPELFGKERTFLRKLVNRAMKLVRERNLLVGGDFENRDNWLLGDLAAIADNLSLFPGHYLFLSQATERKDISTSYAYQKIEEATLKRNTRYRITGFVGASKNLELSIYRYGQEVNKIVTVPLTKACPISSDSRPNCEQLDLHFFSDTIDVGTLHPELNPGIEVSLRITSPDGFATISHLEIVEERSLTAEEIQKMQRKEPKWEIKVKKERAKIQALIQPIIKKISAFFTDASWEGKIRPLVTYQDLYSIVLPDISALPELRQWIQVDSEGKSYMILHRLKNALQRLYTYIEEQNLLYNGNFSAGLRDWIVEGDAQITTLESGNRALQLSNFDATASQAIDILDFDEEKEYQLIIRAKGDGTITIQHGEDAIETLTPRSQYGFYFYQSEPLSFETASLILQLQSEDSAFIVDHVEIICLSSNYPKKPDDGSSSDGYSSEDLTYN
ncbi:metallophosphoesterase [Bacillus cereus]